MDNEGLGDLINRCALKYNLRPDIVACQVIQESNGNPFAFRYEHGFFQRYIAMLGPKELAGHVPPVNVCSLETEKRARANSWGLLQVMGETARSIGQFKNDFLSSMCDPEIGMDMGCKILRHYLSKDSQDNYARALSRYNTGRPESDAGQIYTTKIFNRIVKREHMRFNIEYN